MVAYRTKLSSRHTFNVKPNRTADRNPQRSKDDRVHEELSFVVLWREKTAFNKDGSTHHSKKEERPSF